MANPRTLAERSAAKALIAVQSFKGDKRSAEFRSLKAELTRAQATLDAFNETPPDPQNSEPLPAANGKEAQEQTHDEAILANGDAQEQRANQDTFTAHLAGLAPEGEKVLFGKRTGDGGMWPADTLAPGASLYVNTGSFIRERMTEGDRAKLENIEQCVFLLLDDVGTKAKTPPLEPSWKIETSPGNQQWGYVYQPDQRPTKAEQTAAVRAIAAAGYSDPGASGAVRWGRIPGSLHHAKGCVSRLVEWHPERTFTLPEILAALNVTPAMQAIAAAAPFGLQASPDAVADWLRSAGLVKREHADRLDIVCPMGTGHDDDGASSTSYFLPSAANGGHGGFCCQHGKCNEAAQAMGAPTWTVDHLIQCAVSRAASVPAAAALLPRLLARLHPQSYETLRMPCAKAMGWRVASLDEAVKAAGGQWADITAMFRQQAQAVQVQQQLATDPTAGWLSDGLAFQPLTAPEDGAQLLADLVALIKRYVFCSDDVAVGLAAWAMMTWMQDRLDLMPKLNIFAPAMRCGKSRAMEVEGLLCFNPITCANTSAAAIYRLVNKGPVTLLLDEVDAWLKSANDDMRGIINAGHTRATSKVLRVDPDTLEAQTFDLFCSMALAGIGTLPATVADRSIPALLKRKLANEQAAKLRHKDKALFTPYRARIHRWMSDNAEAIAERIQSDTATAKLGDNDRAQDNWEPLIAIADQAGGNWGAVMRSCAERLTAAVSAGESHEDQLLLDIRQIIATNPAPWCGNGGASPGHVVQGNHVPVNALRLALNALDSGWELKARSLGNMLTQYGIESKTANTSAGKAKCYSLVDINQVLERYLKPEKQDDDAMLPDWLQGGADG